MSSKHLHIILLALAVIAFIIIPVSAADTKVDNVIYDSKIYQETSAYTLGDVPQPLNIDTIPPEGIIGTKEIAKKPNQILPQYVLVGIPGEDITLIFSIATDGTRFTTDLINPRITLDDVPVTANTIDRNGKVKVIGTIPNKQPNSAVKLIELENLPTSQKEKINQQFIVYTTTKDVEAAKSKLFLLNLKYSESSPEGIKDNLQIAWDSYHAGDYLLALQAAKGGLDVSTTTEETTGAATWILVVAIIVCVFVGILIGIILDRFWFRRDLTTLERLVLKYYRMRSENPFAPARISVECEKALERAFDFNASRADVLAKQANDRGNSRVNPDSFTGANLKPSLLQALYEKKTFGRSAALKGGMEHLHTCLDKAAEGNETNPSAAPEKSTRNIVGRFRI